MRNKSEYAYIQSISIHDRLYDSEKMPSNHLFLTLSIPPLTFIFPHGYPSPLPSSLPSPQPSLISPFPSLLPLTTPRHPSHHPILSTLPSPSLLLDLVQQYRTEKQTQSSLLLRMEQLRKNMQTLEDYFTTAASTLANCYRTP